MFDQVAPGPGNDRIIPSSWHELESMIFVGTKGGICELLPWRVPIITIHFLNKKTQLNNETQILGCSPCEVTVTTRIIPFLVGNPEVNLHHATKNPERDSPSPNTKSNVSHHLQAAKKSIASPKGSNDGTDTPQR